MSESEHSQTSKSAKIDLPDPLPNRPLLLLVDVNRENIAMLQQVFSVDHEVVGFASGEAALEFCRLRLPDLILLGLANDDMDSHQMCLRLKGDTLTYYVPIILIANRSDAFEEIKGLKGGAVDFIVMPIQPAVMRVRIQTHLMLRRATKRILAFTETLETRVEERTAELKRTMETLADFREKLVVSETKATLSTIVASVSHELATPIGNSAMMASMLVKRAKAVKALIDEGKVKRSDLSNFIDGTLEGCDLMESNINRARDLIKNFKQVAADQASEQRREFDLAKAIKEVLDSLAPSLKHKPNRVVQDIPTGIVMDSQPGRIGQIVINLVNNAYMHAFEDRTDGVLTIAAEQIGDEVMLRFADNGVGIPEENLKSIFAPFFSTKINRGGTGLGMTIVGNLVRKSLGGSIEVRSTVGVGTTFEIRLPRVAATEESH